MKNNSPRTYAATPKYSEIQDTLGEILKRVAIDEKHDIPYLAGYSTDRSKIYIDRHMPNNINGTPIDRFLILHEAVEKGLIDVWNMGYEHAHAIATLAEHEYIQVAGIDQKEYDAFMDKWVKSAESELIERVPADLDLTPYIYEGETVLLEKMRDNMVP